MSKLIRFAIGSCLIFLFYCSSVVAQSATATLSGTIVDQNGAVVPGVAVTIQNAATAFERTAATNESGNFTIPLLPPGTYTVTARRDGFTVVKVLDVVLNVGDRKALAVQLKVGDVNAEVVVTSDASLVSTSPGVSTTIDRTFVGNLPLNGRSFRDLLVLTPGVVLVTGTAGGISVNGQRTDTNYFAVDGVGANISISPSQSAGVGSPGSLTPFISGSLPGLDALGTTSNLVTIDALEEFTIQTSGYTAEFGRQSGAQVQVVTRSGANKFHGSLFEYLRNDVFDANDWFANSRGRQKPPLRHNIFGGTVSGPVFLPRFGEGGKPFWSGRDRTFFFVSYEARRLRLPAVTNINVPSLRLRQQVANPALRPILNAFSLPTGPELLTPEGELSGAAPYFDVHGDPSSSDSTSIRIDHAVSKKLSLSGRYSHAPSFRGSRSGSVIGGTAGKTDTLTLGATLALSQRLSNQLSVNYSLNRSQSFTDVDDFGGAVPIDISLLTTGYTGGGRRTGGFSFDIPGISPGFSIGFGDNVDSFQQQFNIVDGVTLVTGPHNLRFGFDYRRLTPRYGPFEYGTSAGLYSNDGTLADFEDRIRTGTINDYSITARQGARPLYQNFSVYAQDTWKLSSRLTFDLGLRLEYNPAPHDASGAKPVFAVMDGKDVTTARLSEPDEPFYKLAWWKSLAPRIGVAYAIRQKQGRETMLRGSFGIYAGRGGQALATQGWLTSVPFQSFIFRSDVLYPVSPELAAPRPFEQVGLPFTAPIIALNPELKLPYTMSWNLSLQQSLGTNDSVTASYVGNASRRLLMQESLNNRPRDPVTGALLPRPNPNFNVISFASNGPTSDYHSMQLQYGRRLSSGLQALANYTWAHAIDEASSDLTHSLLVRGNSSFDIRHAFSAGISYDLPTPKVGDLLKAVLRNWSVNGVVIVQSGAPVDLSAGTITREDGSRINVRPDLVLPNGPFYIEDPSVAGGRRFNSAAFADPPRVAGQFVREGTFGRNVLRGLGMNQINMSLQRQFTFWEELKVQVRAEAFNLFNHPNFSFFDNTFQSTNFGVPFAMLNLGLDPGVATGGRANALSFNAGGPRSLQFTVRVNF